MTNLPAQPPALRIHWKPVIALVLYSAFLVATAPATLVAWALSFAMNGIAILEGAQGDLWRGQAEALLVADRSGGVQRFQRLRWELLFARLIAGEAALRIEIEDPKLRGSAQVALRTDAVSASHVAFRIPASALTILWPDLSAAQLSGDLLLRSKEISLGDDGHRGMVTIEWRNAESAVPGVGPLGDYRALVTATGPRVKFQIATTTGAVHLEGGGDWSRQAGLTFKGIGRFRSTGEVKLDQMLSGIGVHLGGGYTG